MDKLQALAKHLEVNVEDLSEVESNRRLLCNTKLNTMLIER